MPTRDGVATVPAPRHGEGGAAEVISGQARPRLGRFVRMRPDRPTGGWVLLGPETVVVLNRTGHAVLRLCDGERTVDQIVAALVEGHDDADEFTVGEQVRGYLDRLADRNLVAWS
ncbi:MULTISPECIES: pyrroloquinoline quinone biosynthesis peptide chaperone PqqD [Pseudonocardia]|uniref:pyrroloquinoline quinone biosynthesis peptide chaperone PqqD n=1 Tax=Pseudonocardia TaxID=1847 RepID=UPI000A28462D|nr:MULTISPECIES: pyrroloquinoline quinone biosynthesis peptide chaperone PqqD [Pseudonocardia]BBG01693.1 hypothetical protein Pdca_29020 [Pseudonocardia autotrophica]